jgi:hypothetical protein
MAYVIALLVLAALLVGSAAAVLIALARLEEILPPSVQGAGRERRESPQRGARGRAAARQRHP